MSSMKLSRRLTAGFAALSLAAFLASIYLLGTPPVISQGIQILTSLNGTEQVPLNYPCTVSCGVTTETLIGFSRQQAGSAGDINALVATDYGLNPFKRGTSSAASAHIGSLAAVYGPDQTWFAGGGASSIDWSQQLGASDTLQTYVGSLRMQRTSSTTDVAQICMGHVLESSQSIRFQGHTAWLEFHVKAGANYSGVSLTVTVAYGTDTDASSTNFQAGTWTNYTVATSNNGTTNTVTPTTTWVRPTMSFLIPIQVASTNVTDIGVKYCWTPSGTAGANDWLEFTGEQLEVNDTGQPSAFYHVPASEAVLRSLRYLTLLSEPAAGVPMALGTSVTQTSCEVVATFAPMRAAPSLATAGNALATTTWEIYHAATLSTLISPYLTQGTGNTPTSANLSANLAGSTLTAGQVCVLSGNAGGSRVLFSAEL